jgi:putative photosynthetic complex assembly protein
MSEVIETRPFPRGALIAGAFLIGTSLLFATVARLTDLGATRLELAPVTASRDLTFKDLADGSIAVYDAGLNKEIAELAPGQSGFVRVVMRGLARERMISGAGPDVPFRLRQHSDGIASLEDLATGQVVTLTAFGSSNAQAFAQFMDSERTTQ